MQHRVIDDNTSHLTVYKTPNGYEGKHIDACEFLNALYTHLVGVGDFESAFQCAAEAYRLNPRLGVLVGAILEKGILRDRTPYSHIHYYYTAAMYGEPTAYNSLGKCFFYGIGVPKNWFYAQLYFSTGYNYQNAESSYYLGYLHQFAFFLPGGFDIAFKYYAQSHIWGCSFGTMGLAQCYEYGVSVKANIFEALALYQDARFRRKIKEDDLNLRRLEYLVSPRAFNAHLRAEHAELVSDVYSYTMIFKRPCPDNVYMFDDIRERLLELNKMLLPSDSIRYFLQQAISAAAYVSK